jgi:hypothetical protein
MLFAIMLTKRTIMGEQEREEVPGWRAGEIRKYAQEKSGGRAGGDGEEVI